MSTLASLRILLGLDSGDVTKGAARVRGELTGVQREANKTRDAFASIKQGIGLGLGLGTFNIAARGAQELTQFIGDSITKASALNETMSKSAVIFGQNAKVVEAWGKTTAQAFGLSQQAAIDARANIANLFGTMGLGQQEALSMSGSLVALSADLTSFFDLADGEALLKLRAGLVGEAEPLRVLGVQLTEATVKTKALELGLVGANGVLSESAKVQARYAIILEDTATAQGNFALTSDDLANSQRSLDAALTNIQAKVGAGLLPILAGGAQLITNDLLPSLEDAAAGIGAVGDAAAAAFTPVADFFGLLGAQDEGFDFADLLPVGGGIVKKLGETGAALKELGAEAKAFEDAANGGSISLAQFTAREQGATEASRELGTVVDLSAKAMLDKREAELAAADALAEYKKWTDLAGDSAAEANNNLLDFASGANTAANDAIAAAQAAKELQAELALIERSITIDIQYKIATAPFINPNALPGTADANRANAFDSGGDQAALDQATANWLARDRAAKEKAAREQAARDAAARGAAAAANTAAREAEAAGAKRSADEARRHADMLADQFEAAKDKARDYFDVLHDGNLRAIDDIRDRANEELSAQQKAIRGVVSAEQARINAVRAREQENSLRAAVEAAEPEDRAGAQRDLNRFLEDQRLGRMSVAADLAVAQIDAEKAKNDAIAAEATNAENTRAADQRAAFDTEIAALQKNLSRHPEEWAKTQTAIAKLLRDSVPAYEQAGRDAADAYKKGLGGVMPAVSATSPNATAASGLGSAASTTLTLVQHIYIDGVLDRVERGQATLQSIYNPAPPSASGRV